MAKKYVICANKEEAAAAEMADMLYILCYGFGGSDAAWKHQSVFQSASIVDAYYNIEWPSRDFAVLVDTDEE